MKIILAIKNAKQKNVAFVTDDLKILSFDAAIRATREGKIDSTYVVGRKTGAYIRTKSSVPKSQELETISISVYDLIAYAQGANAVTTPALGRYIELYLSGAREGQPFIKPFDKPKVLTSIVKEKVIQNRSYILTAARAFNVDPNIIAAIIIDETARLSLFEDITDLVGAEAFGANTSIGVAQVKPDTANDMIKKKLYNPNPEDPKLPFARMNWQTRAHFYPYLIDPKHNIFFEAAYIRSIIDYWMSKSKTDLSQRPEIIGTLYSQGYGKPKTDPQANPRGAQIGGEFYNLAKKWLDEAEWGK